MTDQSERVMNLTKDTIDILNNISYPRMTWNELFQHLNVICSANRWNHTGVTLGIAVVNSACSGIYSGTAPALCLGPGYDTYASIRRIDYSYNTCDREFGRSRPIVTVSNLVDSFVALSGVCGGTVDLIDQPVILCTDINKPDESVFICDIQVDSTKINDGLVMVQLFPPMDAINGYYPDKDNENEDED